MCVCVCVCVLEHDAFSTHHKLDDVDNTTDSECVSAQNGLVGVSVSHIDYKPIQLVHTPKALNYNIPSENIKQHPILQTS